MSCVQRLGFALGLNSKGQKYWQRMLSLEIPLVTVKPASNSTAGRQSSMSKAKLK